MRTETSQNDMKSFIKITIIGTLFATIQAILALDLTGFEGLDINFYWVSGIGTMLFLGFLLFKNLARLFGEKKV